VADKEEKDGRLKEKTVVPVVPGGKVEILPKRLWGKELTGTPVFQIQAVQFCIFGNPALEGINDTLVSHVSHRRARKVCVKRTVYVKSAFMIAWGKGFEMPSPSQGPVVHSLYRAGQAGDSVHPE
jgi:hypothetical protein